MTRRYCGRVGGAVEYDDEKRCPECGSAPGFHRAMPSDQCGAWVGCEVTAHKDYWGETKQERGHLCVLKPGHEGDHTFLQPGEEACRKEDHA
jgi:hypothetical protein